MTLIEVLIAMVIMVTVSVSLLVALNSSRRLVTDAEVRDTASAVAQGEIERLEALAWGNIALSKEPTKNAGAGTLDPTDYISSGPCAGSSKPPSTSPCYQWDWNNGSSVEPLVISASTTDGTPNPNPWSDTISVSNTSVRVSGSIYRYITWVNDPNCTSSSCGGSTDYKRITVAVTSNRLSTPVVLSTLFVNPAGGKVDPLEQAGVKCLDKGSLVPCTH